MAAQTTSCMIKPSATGSPQFPRKLNVYNLLHANSLPKFIPLLQKGQPCHVINIKLARFNVRKAASKLARNGSVICAVAALPAALLFDCDGVLVDTERDGHRVSFNEAFSEKGLNVTWDVDLYGELLKIGGGKERMTAYFNKIGWPDIAPTTESERKELIASLHRRKTELFMALIEKRLLPLRPGVARLIDEALEKGVKVAICSTSNEKAVSAIVQCLLGPPRADAISIFAGDIVPRKKPDPEEQESLKVKTKMWDAFPDNMGFDGNIELALADMELNELVLELVTFDENIEEPLNESSSTPEDGAAELGLGI